MSICEIKKHNGNNGNGSSGLYNKEDCINLDYKLCSSVDYLITKQRISESSISAIVKATGLNYKGVEYLHKMAKIDGNIFRTIMDIYSERESELQKGKSMKQVLNLESQDGSLVDIIINEAKSQQDVIRSYVEGIKQLYPLYKINGSSICEYHGLNCSFVKQGKLSVKEKLSTLDGK